MNNLLRRDKAIGVVVDFQERLMPAMENMEGLESTVSKLVKGLGILHIPILVTQQYTKGLGQTVPAIDRALGEYQPIEKNTFSALRTDEFRKKLEDSGKKQIILLGIETHICVQQTALDFIGAGYTVFVVADGCSSRKVQDRNVAFRRMAEAGVNITTYEAVLYELLGGAKAEGFKEISAIVK